MIYSVGAILGAIFVGQSSELFGRRRTIMPSQRARTIGQRTMLGSVVFPGVQDVKDCNVVRRIMKIQKFSVGECIRHKNPIRFLRLRAIQSAHSPHLRAFQFAIPRTVLDSSARCSGDHGTVQSFNREEHRSRRINLAITESEPYGNQRLNFRCSDIGPKNCDWQVSGIVKKKLFRKSSSMVVRSTT